MNRNMSAIVSKRRAACGIYTSGDIDRIVGGGDRGLRTRVRTCVSADVKANVKAGVRTRVRPNGRTRFDPNGGVRGKPGGRANVRPGGKVNGGAGGRTRLKTRERVHDRARDRARSPKHLIATMARGMMWSWRRCELADQVAVAAARALACALATTPKPGVADRAERGEWDKPGVRGGTAYFSFLDSTAALLPYFRDCATAGFDGAADAERSGEGGNPRAAFESLCGAGKLAQAKMAKITGNADAHKGLIFSLGVLCAAYGWLRRTKTTLFPGELFDTCRDMTEGVMGELSDIAVEHAKVCVERGAALSGVVGIRGEVSRGFPNVREYSLPMLRGMLQRGHGMNDAGLAAFLALLAHVDDMAILNDSNAATLHDIQRAAAEFLASNPTDAEMRRWAGETDLQFADRDISAGGCADLLVVTFFVWNLFRD